MLKQFENHINTQLPFLKDSKLLIAISGGLDSVVLTHLCKAIQFNLALAHCNFNLRGDESDGDEEFVLDLADNLDLEVFVESFDCNTYANAHKISTQMAARELRYNWFNELCEQLQFDFVLTAHHADDNLETFLINLSRGTGLEGLTGIPEINDVVIRPLLPFSREQIEQYANNNKLKWREDSSNATTKYLRNKIRHDIVPKLKELSSQFLNNFQTTQSHLAEAKSVLEDRLVEAENQFIKTISEDAIYLDIQELLKLNNPKAYLYYFLKDFGFTQWDDVSDLLTAQSGKQIFSSTHRLIKDREVIILTHKSSANNFEIQIQKSDNHINTTLGNISFKNVSEISQTDTTAIYVDKDLLKYPLTVRKWQEGDYFCPFGMKGKKKLSKFFKDEKLSLLDKENTWLLCSNNQIIWVIGRRLDNRFRVTTNTSKILKIELQ